MKQEKSAGAVVFYYDEEQKKLIFLLLKYPSYWGFAKGWLESGESEEEAAIREIKEEAGLENIRIIPKFKHEQKWFFKQEGELVKKEAVYFLAETSKEEAEKTRVSSEHEDFCWFSYEDALKLIKIRANKEMLDKSESFIKEYKKQRRLK